MRYSSIQLSYRDGSVPVGKKVLLAFHGAFTSPAFTDSRGVATCEHESTGTATVYVDGRSVGTMSAPGRAAFQV